MNHKLMAHGTVRAWGNCAVLSRRSVLGVACLAPFAVRPARAAELVTFADISVADDHYTEKARQLAAPARERRRSLAPPRSPGVHICRPSCLRPAVVSV